MILRLPDMSGEQVLRTLKSTLETADILDVILTAGAIHAKRDQLSVMGAHGPLTKPHDFHRLCELEKSALWRTEQR